jgi:hypothetical protein
VPDLNCRECALGTAHVLDPVIEGRECLAVKNLQDTRIVWTSVREGQYGRPHRPDIWGGGGRNIEN